MAKYLITGGAGFIGSNIAYELVLNKHNVTIFDNLHSGNIKNLSKIRNKISFIKGDIRDAAAIKKACTGIDYVLHQAALRSVFQSVKDPIAVNETNVSGTLNVLMAARDAKVKRFVFASSSSVYGSIGDKNNVETLPTKPISPYGLTKLIGEEYCQLFYESYKLNTVILRYFNVFGPNQNPDDDYAAVIPIFVKNALQDKPSIIHGNGLQSRDFTFVDNIVQANIKATTSQKVVFGETYNISSGGNVTIKELYHLIQKYYGKKIKPIHGPARPGDIAKSHAIVNKAKRYLEYKPSGPFSKDLEKALTWYSNNYQ